MNADVLLHRHAASYPFLGSSILIVITTLKISSDMNDKTNDGDYNNNKNTVNDNTDINTILMLS